MSIFSINDNSNYTSILSQAKANKESKENSKISFANAFLKQNASKLNEIQSANSQTLIRSESLNNNLNSNFDTNYGLFSDFQNTVHTLKYKQADISTSTNTAYGYSVDKDGYMGSDFNKAAGLPEDFKIHKSTLDEIKKAAENEPYIADMKQYFGVSEYYTNIDMAETIKQYYNLFSNALGQSFPNDKTSFSEADINSMPKGYAINGIKSMDFNDPSNRMNITHLRDFSNSLISNVYKTPEQAKEADEIWLDSGCMIKGLSSETLGLSLEEIKNVSKGEDWQFNPDMSVYPQNEDGSYSKEALFMSFLKSYGSGQPVESSETTLNPKVEAYNRAMAKESFSGPAIHLDSIMTGKSDFKSFFRYWAERGIEEGDLYMYENNIPKESAMGNWALDAEIKQAIANGWKAKPSTINSYADSIMDRLNNLIGQTRV
ncbi:Cj0814 family flagellar-dependent secreted protein [Campylobacter coli]